MEINWIGIGAATIAAFVLGGLWYGPLFGKKWQALVGLSEDDVKNANMAKIFGGAFVLTFIAAFVFAMFLGPNITLQQGLAYGASAGACWVAAGMGINYLFAQKPFTLWLIDGGYMTLMFTLFGACLALL